MQTPAPLTPGDTIGIVSTARKITEEELQPAIEWLTGLGYQVRLGTSIGAADNQFAGDDNLRTADMQAMLDDESIRAIWCARGGYGTVRIIDKLNFSRFQQNPKWLIGYSDITVLHTHITRQLGIQTVHATMPVNVPDNTAEALQSLNTILSGGLPEYRAAYHELNRTGSAAGKLTGGNLSVLYSLTGSASMPDAKGKVLFLEDLDEYLYHIDRMMMQLKRAGLFEGISGLLIGGMTDMNDNTIPFGRTAVQIIAEQLAHYDFPVAFDLPAGHIDDNRALLMGGKVSMEVTPGGTTVRYTD